MKITEAIRTRRSVRTMEAKPLSDSDSRLILSFAQKAENPFGLTIEWRILSASENGLSSPVIVGADTYIAGKLRQVPYAEEAFGYSFESIVLYAETLGVGTTWIAGTMDRGAFERAMELGEGEVMPCVSPLGYPAKRMSVRESMMRKGIRADSRLEYGKLFFDGSFEKPLTPESAGVLNLPLESVRLAPSAVNKQPWRIILDGDRLHFFEQRSKGYINDSGWDIQKIDLGIAMCHFFSSLEEIGTTAELEIRPPEISVPQNTEYIASFLVK